MAADNLTHQHRSQSPAGSRSNADRLRAALSAFNRSALDELANYCDPSVTYIIRGHGPLGGMYEGFAAIAAALKELREITANTLTVVPTAMVEGEDTVMAYMHVTASRPDGRTLDTHNAYLYRFRDGRLIEGQTIPVDQAAFDVFTAD